MPDRDIRATGRARWLPRPWRQVGYRGKTLIILGVAWCVLGLEAFRLPVADYLYHELYIGSPQLRGGSWIASGLVAICTAFRPKGMPDALAWPLLYVMPAFRAAMYFIAWVDHMVPSFGGDGYEHGWIYTIMFGAMALVVMFLSSWPEPYPPVIEERKRRRWLR